MAEACACFLLRKLTRQVTQAYDRAVGYWSATELVFAAQGVAHFIARGAAMRLMVGVEGAVVANNILQLR